MFADKIEKMKEQQKIYLETVTGYHDLIEALLFREQKKYFGSIEYITNRFNAIDINILESKDIQRISLPFYDPEMRIWKSKLFSIDQINNNPKQIIGGYTIEIKKVDELESSRYKQLAELNEELSELKEEYEELLKFGNENKKLDELIRENSSLKQEIDDLNKLKGEELLGLEKEYKKLVKSKDEELSRLKQEYEELATKLNDKNSRLKQKKEELAKLNDENSRLEQENEELATKLKDENSSLREQYEELAKLNDENVNLRLVIDKLANQCCTKYNIDNLIVKDDNIIRGTPFMFELVDQGDIKFTLSELIRSDYVIRREKIELVVNSMTIENVNVEFVRESNEFIYRYDYSKKYKYQKAIFPADGKTEIILTDDANRLAYEMDNYTVWFYVTLK